MRLDPTIDQLAARVAKRHFGYLTPAQAGAVGYTRAALRSRVANGLLERRGRLVRVAGAPECWRGQVYASVMNATTGTLAGGVTAAALFGWCDPPRRPQVLVPPWGNARVPGAAVARLAVDPRDVTRIGVIPVTTPARTLLDCARSVGFERLCELVDQCLVTRKASVEAVEAAIARAMGGAGRRGVHDLRASLEIWQPGMRHDSVAECRMFRLMLAWGLPMPEPLHVIRDDEGRAVCEVDAAWVEPKIALEYDSALHHGPRRWPKDEARASAAEALGWIVEPVDKSDLLPGGHERFRAQLLRRFAERGAACRGGR